MLNVSLDQSVSHTRAYYDTVFDELASSTHLEDEARVRADVDRHRSIRSYPAAGFGSGKLREAVMSLLTESKKHAGVSHTLTKL